MEYTDKELELEFYKSIVEDLEVNVLILWRAVQDGIYDPREIVGDVTLSMAGTLKKVNLGPLRKKE